MIFRETPLAVGTASADLTEKEGYAVKISSSKVVVLSAATDLPIGVLHVTGDSDTNVEYIRQSYQGEVGVKLDATPGTVAEGTALCITATGTFKALPTTGAAVIAAYACETGEASQLIRATLCAPQVRPAAG